MDIKEEILSLIKQVGPDNPLAYIHSIIQPYACEKLNDHIIMCKDCPICKGPKSFVAGNPNATVLFIGDCVSSEDKNDLFVHPFDENSLKIINRVLLKLGVNKDEVFYINSVNCWPNKEVSGEFVKRAPTKFEVQHCSPFVKYAIEIVQPKLIVLFGNVALNLFKNDAITRARGEWIDINGIKTMPTFHPNYFLEVKNKKSDEAVNLLEWDFYNDIEKAFSYLREKLPDSNIFLN